MAKRLTGLGYGTVKDRHDERDHVYEPPARLKGKLPKKVDLRPHMPSVYNQRHLNSCSAHAIAAALWFEERHRHGNPRQGSPSRLFIYFNERAIEGVLAHNGPVSLRSGYKTVARDGVCSERLWPYDVRRFRWAPSTRCRRAAMEHKAIRYMRLQRNLADMRACLASEQPFTFGFNVHKTFKSQLVKQTGVVPRPSHLDTPLGGHAMLAVGYLDDSHHFIARNSWGRSWGDQGYCYIPYDCLLDPDLAWDFWTVSNGHANRSLLSLVMPLAVGTKIGPYEIVDVLGGGGMGEVYRARDVRLGRIVALKIIRAALGTAADVQRFELEARATSAINHPHIVALYDVGEYEGAPYLVTELLQGETLRSRLARGPIPAAKAIEYARQIASGLAAAHDRGIVHRDLKPENVFITNDGHVKILDFGLAKVKVAAADDELTGQAAFGLTSPGTIVGTVSYMSPEQVRGGDVDHRSDVFSFGAVLYEMLTGRTAFLEKSPVETMHVILNKEPEPVDSGSGAVPSPLAFIVRQCLEKHPRERFQSARDLELHFGAMSSGQVSMQTAEMAAAGPSRRWWILPAAVGAAASLLVAAGAWIVVGQRGRIIVTPEYRQLTYRRGFIDAARFTSDGHTIVYSASWDGAASQAFSMRLENPESRPLDVKAASLLAVSSTGEVAVSLNGQHLPRLLAVGTLARVPIMGGIPREIMNDVVQADWSSDGAVLAVIHRVEGKYRLEYPVGKVLYENNGGLADVRISRDGTTVAFTEHPALPDDRGDICVIGPDGVKRVVSAGYASVSGLAWSPRGDEIWFTASEVGANTSLWAMKPGGTRRLLIRSLGRKTVLDVAPDGQALISEGRLRFMMAYRDAPQAADRLLSWLDASFAADISSDGATIIFDEQGEGTGSHGYSTYLRKSDGSAAIRLGDGYAGSLSPDSQRVAALTVGSPPSVTILPTGAGEATAIARGPVVAYSAVAWTPDGQSVVFAGREQGHGARVYVQNVKDGAPRPVSPEGYTFPPYTAPVSPNGTTIIAAGAAGQLAKISLGDGTVHPLDGSQPGDTVMRWTADGRAVFVARRHDRPASIWRVAAEGGHRDFVLSLAPTDQAGYTSVSTALITPDGRHLAYSFGQNLMDLYLVRGLR